MAKKANHGRIRVGTSGWVYPPWRKGNFYPDKLPQKDELKFAGKTFSSIEINSTFYRLQAPKSFQKWAQETPDDFVFALKAPQIMTHLRRLKDVEMPLANFLASGVLSLGKKMGPILWQFPPTVTLKDSRFSDFFKLLPHESLAAAERANGHSEFLKGKTFLDIADSIPLRHAFEFRHKSFLTPEFLEEMKSHGIGLVLPDSGKYLGSVEDVTGSFVYVRMHGDTKEHEKGYSTSYVKKAAEKFQNWASTGLDVYVYFDSSAKETAPRSAMQLIEELKVSVT